MRTVTPTVRTWQTSILIKAIGLALAAGLVAGFLADAAG